MLTAGLLLVLERIGIVNTELRRLVLWPALLIGAGILMLFKKLNGIWIVTLAILALIPLTATRFEGRNFDARIETEEKDWGITRVEERRNLENFSSLEIWGSGEMEIVNSEEEFIVIEARERDIQNILTKVEDGVLKIRQEDWWTAGFNSPKYRLGTRSLNRITINGAASIRSEELRSNQIEIINNGAARFEAKINSPTVEVKMSGAGLVNLVGEVEKLKVSISGLGEYQGKNLETREAEVIISGAGKAEAAVSDLLEVRISGAGSVDYWGNPRVEESISGLGNVNKKGDFQN